MRKRAAGNVILFASLALLTAGCGSDPEADPRPGAIAQAESTPTPDEPESEPELVSPEVVETGFAVGEYGNAVIVAVLKNPSTTDGGSVTVSGTAYDANDQVLGTSSGNTILRSGETTATANTVSLPEGANIDRVTVQAAFGMTEVDEHPEARITARDVQVVDDGYGTFRANGEAVSAYESDLTNVLATAVCRDAAGAINGGGLTFLDLLPGGGTTGVSIVVTVEQEPAMCEVYANISNLS